MGDKDFTASQSAPQSRTKKFVSYDSLKFEQERLETFIDWPLEYLSPADLAQNGFYYLRTADHCACVFCRGIVGNWDEGDIPREEHCRHFPRCPFIKGQAVGNIPLACCKIISRITCEVSAALPVSSVDVCGSGSYSESSKSPPDLMLASVIGLHRHTGPRRKDFLSQTDRENSFTHWPEMVKQTPKVLSEAGFFYCGLSDHVRCFHCGNGLRNWEKDDDPWQEHAKWYPECNYVILKMGQEYIDGVRREKIPTKKNSSTAKALTNITEEELYTLMQLDVIGAILAMGFPKDKVRATLCRKLEQTGMPFFNLETCIEAVLRYMEEETRLGLQESSTKNGKAGGATTTPSSITTSTTSSLSSSSSSSAGGGGPPSFHQPGEQLACISEEEPTLSPTGDDSQADQVIIGLAEQVPPTSNLNRSSLVTLIASTPQNTHSNLAFSVTSSSRTHDNVTKSAMTLYSQKPQNAQELVEEMEKLQDKRMCKVCMDAEMEIVFLPCSHMLTCSMCASALTQCPICRSDIKYAVKPILS